MPDRAPQVSGCNLCGERDHDTVIHAPRPTLLPVVERAARVIHRAVWRTRYTPGEGPMHWATGPYWRSELLRLADRWEDRARAARVCAEALPDE